MKRLVIMALLLVSFASEAQVVIRSNKERNVNTVSSTVVKKEVIYKERRLYDARRGFQQFVELSPKVDILTADRAHTGINYIGGWRFNNWLFVGAGTGLEFAHDVAHGGKQYIGKTFVWYDDQLSSLLSDHLDVNGSVNLVSIPLYAHIRTYYMRTAWAPYSSVSLGGRMAPKDSGIYFDFSTGVDYRVNEKLHAYFSIGFWLSKFRRATASYNRHGDGRESYEEYENCGSMMCPYRGQERYHYHYTIYDMFNRREISGGMSFRLGVSF